MLSYNLRVTREEVTVYCEDASILPPFDPKTKCFFCGRKAEETRFVNVTDVIKKGVSFHANDPFFVKVVAAIRKKFKHGTSFCWKDECSAKMAIPIR